MFGNAIITKHIQFQLAFNAQVIGLCHDNELLGNAIITKHIQFQLAFNAQVIGLCHDNELLGNAIITKAKLIHIPSHPKMLIIAVNPSRRSISNKL